MSAWPPEGVPTAPELVRARRRAQVVELAMMAQLVMGLPLVAWTWFGPQRFGWFGLVTALAIVPWTFVTLVLKVAQDALLLGRAHRWPFLRARAGRMAQAVAVSLALTSPMVAALLAGAGRPLAVGPMVVGVAAILGSSVWSRQRCNRIRSDLVAGRFDAGLARVAGLGWWLRRDVRDGLHAELLVERGDLDRAQEVVDRAAAGWAPDFAERVVLAGVAVARETCSPEEARAVAVEAVRRLPLSTRANAALAELQLLKGVELADGVERIVWAVDAERRDLRALRAGEERLPVFLAIRAWAFAVVGREGEAREALARIELPSSPVRRAEALLGMHAAWRALGQDEEAERMREAGRSLPGQAARRLRALPERST